MCIRDRILSACGILPVVWLALLTAPYVSGGLVEIIRGLPVAMGNPFEITMCEEDVYKRQVSAKERDEGQ